jgi:hypothetical protein
MRIIQLRSDNLNSGERRLGEQADILLFKIAPLPPHAEALSDFLAIQLRVARMREVDEASYCLSVL